MVQSKATFIRTVLPISIFWILFLGLSTGCTKTHDDGGQIGGGFAAKSTTTDVNDAIDLALKLAAEPEATENIFVQFWLDKGMVSSNPQIKIPAHLFPSLYVNGISDDAGTFDSPALVAIGNSKPIRLASGDCLLGSGETTTDASVSAHTLSAQVCYSVGNLSRIPPTDILRQVLALTIHEASHMGGADEDEARAWQNEFLKYFGERFGDISKGSVEWDTEHAVADLRGQLREAQSLAERNTDDPKIYGAVGRLVERLDTLPYIHDSLALRIKLKPEHPEMVQGYCDSVAKLIDKIKMKFESSLLHIHARGIDVPLSFMSPDLVKGALEDIAKDLDAIEKKFSDTMGDSKAPYNSNPEPVDI